MVRYKMNILSILLRIPTVLGEAVPKSNEKSVLSEAPSFNTSLIFYEIYMSCNVHGVL